MTQFSSPGIQIQHVGSDYRTTPGLYIPVSGGVSGKAVAYQELSAAVTALESAYQTADSSDTAAWTAAYSNLSSQLAALSSGVSSNVAVALKHDGTLASLQALLTVAGANYTVVQGAETVTIVPSTLDTAKTDFYKHGILLSESGQPAKLYFVNGTGTLIQATQFNADIDAGALIYVDKGVAKNSFWQVPDQPTTPGEIEGLIPFGRVQDLQVASASFLTLAANQLNTNLNGDYFTVTGGALTLSTVFLTRVTAIEASVTTEATARAAADTSLQTGLTAEVSARTSDISGLQSRATSIETVNTNQDAAITGHTAQIALTASQASLNAETIARAQADGVLTANLASEVTARTAADTTLTTNLAAEASTRATAVTGLQTRATAIETVNTAQDTAIALKADQTALTTEAAARTSGNVALNTRIDQIKAEALRLIRVARVFEVGNTLTNITLAKAAALEDELWNVDNSDLNNPKQWVALAGFNLPDSGIYVAQTVNSVKSLIKHPAFEFGQPGELKSGEIVVGPQSSDLYAVTSYGASGVGISWCFSQLQTALDLERTTRTSADTAINTSLTDAQATIITHSGHLTALDTQVLDRGTRQQITATIAAFYGSTHRIVRLGNDNLSFPGIFDAVAKTTTFYINFPATPASDMFDSGGWAISRISGRNAPIEEWARPAITYPTARDGVTETRNLAKLVFFRPTQVLNGDVEAYIQAFYDVTRNKFPQPVFVVGGNGSG